MRTDYDIWLANNRLHFIITTGLVGMFVGALYCENNDPLDWHRAKVLSLKMTSASNASVVVSFVDYGTIDEVGLDDIRLLPKAFAQYPCQAIRMELGVIKPPDEAAGWAPQACVRFKVGLISLVSNFSSIW